MYRLDRRLITKTKQDQRKQVENDIHYIEDGY